ncbi:MAG TPA: phosphate ABC transporter substrate-binding protein PstS [Gaiellaceae bacterium]|jgi:phosphate transport system substrate-binding protein|nr:phosphate ABC transporter substrate-binding protein PstS [Gaiellaceae bacterium]
MPKHGMIVRTSLVLVAAALVSGLAVNAAGAAGKKHHVRLSGTLNGAGSSLIAPAIQAMWSPDFKAKGVTVNYASVGSGAGIAQITARTVDFGASDAPMTGAQAAACKGCVQIPWALTSTSVVVNVPGVHQGQLHLTGGVVAKIYLGQITKWNDPAIKALNPGLSLPDLKITVAHRSDGSGDTYAFTNYLHKVSAPWRHQVGYATSVNWPVGVGGKGNSGVAAVIGSTPGSIGYVSVAYVLQNHLTLAKMKNASGKYTLPTIKSIESAAQLVKAHKIPANNAISITDAPKTKNKKYANAYPLATFTYIIVPKKSPQAALIKAWINFAMSAPEQKRIQKLVFAPMPKVVVDAAKKTLKKIHS